MAETINDNNNFMNVHLARFTTLAHPLSSFLQRTGAEAERISFLGLVRAHRMRCEFGLSEERG